MFARKGPETCGICRAMPAGPVTDASVDDGGTGSLTLGVVLGDLLVGDLLVGDLLGGDLLGGDLLIGGLLVGDLAAGFRLLRRPAFFASIFKISREMVTCELLTGTGTWIGGGTGTCAAASAAQQIVTSATRLSSLNMLSRSREILPQLPLQ